MRYREFVLSPYGVIKIKSLGYIHKLFAVPLPIILGIFSGAVTNTPSLGAGQQILTDLGSNPAQVTLMGTGYAMAYPLGICGILLVMWLLRVGFRIMVEAEARQFDIANRLKNDYILCPDMRQRSIAGCYQNNVAWL